MGTSWNEPEETTQVFDSERIEGAASGSERWYISPDGRSKEVLAAREIIERARAGSLSNSTLVWRDGLSDWTRLDSVPELMQAVRAFRASTNSDELATVMIDPGVEHEGGVAIASADGSGSPSLPPLPPVPGAVRTTTSLPPLPALPGSPRPPTQTLSGAPLPPPPSLPPLPGRKSVPDAEREKLNDVSSGAPTTIAKAASGSALSPQAVAANVTATLSGLVAKARPIVGEFTARAKAYLDRDYDLPKVGLVSGRILAAAAACVVMVLLLLFWMTRDDEPSADQANAAASAPATIAAGEAAEARAAGDESGLDLDDDKLAEAKPVSPSELKTLRPGEKPPEVKESVSRSGAATARAAKGKEFDVYAAKSALSLAATKAARCKQGPKGEGSVRVKLAPSGKVASVTVTTPAFQGTAAAACVEQVFRQATVPPFSGDDQTVYKKFVIN